MSVRTLQRAKLARPRLAGAVARERLFARLNEERQRAHAICVVGPPAPARPPWWRAGSMPQALRESGIRWMPARHICLRSFTALGRLPSPAPASGSSPCRRSHLSLCTMSPGSPGVSCANCLRGCRRVPPSCWTTIRRWMPSRLSTSRGGRSRRGPAGNDADRGVAAPSARLQCAAQLRRPHPDGELGRHRMGVGDALSAIQRGRTRRFGLSFPSFRRWRGRR